jgi:hypothetical protein
MKRGFYLEILIALVIIPLLSMEEALSAIKESPEIRQFIANNFELRNQNWSISQNHLDGKVYYANSSGLYELTE